MKKKEIKELKVKPAAELQKMAVDLKNKLWQLKIDLASGKIKNIKEIRRVKKTVARIYTWLKQK